MGVDVGAHVLAGFLDELEKIGASHGRMHVPKERKGRRPMSVTTLLRKEKDGTLFKEARLEFFTSLIDFSKEADAQGNPQPVRGSGADDPGAARLPKRLGEMPTRGPMVEQEEKTGNVIKAFNRAFDRYYNRPVTPPSKKNDPNVVDRMDGRGEATTISGLGQRSADIGIGGGEHY